MLAEVLRAAAKEAARRILSHYTILNLTLVAQCEDLAYSLRKTSNPSSALMRGLTVF